MKKEFFVCEISAAKSEDSLVELKVAVVGKWSGHYAGSFEITEKSLQEIKANFDNRLNDCVIDYEHNSLQGKQNPAAGWIKSLEIRENALFAKIAWNPKAKEFIEKGEYKYLSPTFQMHYKDPRSGADCGVFLHSVALTNTPFLDSLGEVKANSNPYKKGETMDKEKLEALEAENKALKEQLKATQDTLEKANAQMACSLVDSAFVACKITEGQKEWALSYAKRDLEGFTKFLETTQPQALPQNNLFANSNTKNTATPKIDVVKLTLES
ncbi:MAG: phage protease [Helicobacter sp.]|uniref:phage protease n=1 Tax=Helicobacter sp. TaxID=218 RepID=UPI0023CCF3B5|nr:phage protease [Helicobacter sp.]MDE7175747.1 phage protease [Helicobacter sp.]